MKVICAGFGRTGTLSLKYALEELGIRCYHTNDMNIHDFRLWNDLLEGKVDKDNFDYDTIYQNPKDCCQGRYEACCDFPNCLVYKQLMKQYPDAKVILTTREVEGWMKSMTRIVPIYLCLYELLAMFGDIGERFRYLCNLVTIAGGQWWADPAIGDRWLNGHIAEVKAHVPADKLLVFSVKQGWSPLCKFLGVPEPTTSFPRANSNLSTHMCLWLTTKRIIYAERWTIFSFFALGMALLAYFFFGITFSFNS